MLFSLPELRAAAQFTPRPERRWWGGKADGAGMVWTELVRALNDNTLLGSQSSSAPWERGGEGSAPGAMEKGQGSHLAKSSESAQRNSGIFKFTETATLITIKQVII